MYINAKEKKNMSYNIFQIKMTDEILDFVNSKDGGHTNTANKYPEYNARLETSHRGAEGYTADMFDHYTQVCSVKDCSEYSENKLELVFKILNGYYADEEGMTDETFDKFVSGFKMKTYLNKRTKEVREVRDMHSLSVGDIIEDTIAGTFHIVDGCGFSEINVRQEEVA